MHRIRHCPRQMVVEALLERAYAPPYHVPPRADAHHPTPLSICREFHSWVSAPLSRDAMQSSLGLGGADR
jgi:hypothetical protein